jgi:hypothetical protein
LSGYGQSSAPIDPYLALCAKDVNQLIAAKLPLAGAG